MKKIAQPKIAYDKASKALSLEVGNGRSVDSDMQNNMVIDYDRKGNIVRLVFYGFDFEKFRDSFKVFQQFTRDVRATRVMRQA